jgi:hypothetical protein
VVYGTGWAKYQESINTTAKQILEGLGKMKERSVNEEFGIKTNNVICSDNALRKKQRRVTANWRTAT